MSAISRVIGQSGRRYLIEKVIQEREHLGRVCLATAGNRKYIIKDVPSENYKNLETIYDKLQGCPYIRVPADGVREQSQFVYNYFTGHLLTLARKEPPLPLPITKRILKDVLRAIAAIHEQDIVHTDIKADNVMIEWQEEQNNVVIEQVQVADLEDSAILPPGANILGLLTGNHMWRSPEAHASARVNKPSDIFSFGAVCVYAVEKLVMFAVDPSELREGEEMICVILSRHLSYFSDEESYNGLIEYLGDSPWAEGFQYILEDYFDGEEKPHRPFRLWTHIEEDFRDLVSKLMVVDPKRRLTAQQALAHKWFADVE